MADERSAPFGFAAAADVPIPYMERTRTYYEAQDKPTYVVKHALSGSRDIINDELLPKLQVTPQDNYASVS